MGNLSHQCFFLFLLFHLFFFHLETFLGNFEGPKGLKEIDFQKFPEQFSLTFLFWLAFSLFFSRKASKIHQEIDELI